MISIKLIHTLKNKAGISDAEYRAILLQYGGVRSCKDLDEPSYRQICAILRGSLPAVSSSTPVGSGAFRDDPRDKQERYIWVLWFQLKKLLPPCDRNELYFVGIMDKALGNVKLNVLSGKRISLDQLSSGQKHKLIESLKKRIDYSSKYFFEEPAAINGHGNNLSKNPELENVPF